MQTLRYRQAGVTTVEFAIIAVVFFMALFGVIEMGRTLFVVNTLTEAARRGARMATVCPVGDTAPARAAVFDSGNGTSAVIYGLTTGNIEIDYLDANGNVLPNPAASFGALSSVRATVVGFTLPLMSPLVMPTLTLSGFATTLPRESLGVPRSGAVTPC